MPNAARYPTWDRILNPQKYEPKKTIVQRSARQVNRRVRAPEMRNAMKLIWKFNLVLLGIFVLGFVIAGYLSYRALQANAREEILQNARLMMEAALSSRNYTINAGQAAARDADEIRVPAADGARLRGDRAVQRAAQEASGLLVQGGDAQSHQSAQPRRRLGGRRRQHLPQHADDQPR